MNKIESADRAKALRTSNMQVFNNLITQENGAGGGGISEGDCVSFAPNYKANENYFLTQNNGFDSIIFFATIGEEYDENNLSELFVSIFVRRFGIKDTNGNRHFPTINNVVYKGSIKAFFVDFAGKTLKCVSIEQIETEYGTRNVYHWETVTPQTDTQTVPQTQTN